MEILRRNIASANGKLISGILLILLLLNNILIPEMKRFSFNAEIKENTANLIEIIVENVLESELYEPDEHDDSSDNLVDSIQKFLGFNLGFEFQPNIKYKCHDEGIYPTIKLTKGYNNLDTPPPQFL